MQIQGPLLKKKKIIKNFKRKSQKSIKRGTFWVTVQVGKLALSAWVGSLKVEAGELMMSGHLWPQPQTPQPCGLQFPDFNQAWDIASIPIAASFPERVAPVFISWKRRS